MHVRVCFRRGNPRLCTVALLFLAVSGPLRAPARTLGPTKTPDELMTAADVVCNGIPTAFEQTDLIGHFNDPSYGLQVRYVVARVKVIGKAKGDVPPEIRVRYPVVDPRGDRLIINGPIQISLEPETKYRFYLKVPVTGTDGCYTGVLDGEFDDYGAVERLGTEELDDSPPVLRARAEQLAGEYVRQLRPGYVFIKGGTGSDYEASPGQVPCWVVVFHSVLLEDPPSPFDSKGRFRPKPFHPKHRYPYPPSTADAEVAVNPPGKANPNSYVGVELPRLPGHHLSGFQDKLVRMMATPRTSRNGRLVQTADYQAYEGRVKKATDEAVSGVFRPASSATPIPMKILKRDIESIQEVMYAPR